MTDEAGGESDGKAAADLNGADRCGAGTASGCEADGEARGTGGGEFGEAGREVGGANDGTGGDETGGEANRMVADLRREADGSEDCGAHCGVDTELGHVRRELFAELSEVGASAATAAAASAASAAAPTETPPRPKRARKSIQRFDPVQAERGGGGCRPLYPKFSAPPAGPLQAAGATFPDMA